MSIERDSEKYIFIIQLLTPAFHFHLFIEKPREFIDIFRYSLRPERSNATEEGAFAISQKKGRSHRPSRIDRFIFSPPLIDEKTPIRARVNPAR